MPNGSEPAAHRLRLPSAGARLACAVLLFSLGTPPVAPAQEEVATGTLEGRVVDEVGDPVAGATVRMADAGREVVTDSAGGFRLRAVPAGRRWIEVRRLGFEAPRTQVVVPAGARLAVELRLATRPVPIATVTVLGTRGGPPELPPRMREVPGAVAYVDRAAMEGTRQANLHDVLRLVPGVWVQPRFGAADKMQLSIRGSGLRSAIELRGVNVLVEGMPFRNADGFADFEALELLAVRAVRVYPAGNALRLGGATLGGAIDLELETGRTAPDLELFAEGGSYGFLKGGAAAGLSTDDADLYVSYARTDLDGYRDHTVNGRDRATVHGGWKISPATELRALYSFASAREERPGGLTAEQVAEDPRQAHPAAVARSAGRSYTFHHLGIRLRARLGEGKLLEVTPWLQRRPVEVTQARIVEQENRDSGIEVRYESAGRLAGRASRLTLGFQGAVGISDHREYENLEGERGALTKDQRDEAASIAVYAEDVIEIGGGLSAALGVRYDGSRRALDDAYIVDGDDSDAEWYDALQPRAGLTLEVPSAGLQLFGNAGRLYEPPLLLELNSLPTAGFIDLVPQTAWQFELGARGRARWLQWSVSAWDLELRDEILNVHVPAFPGATFTIPTQRNADRTRHYGLEVGAAATFPSVLAAGDELAARLAWTSARYEFVEDSTWGGNEIPGAPRHVLQAELGWRHRAGIAIRPSLEWVPGDYFVDSGNTARNNGWTAVGLRVEWGPPTRTVQLFLELRNLTDARYAAAVLADNALGRFYLPADGRSVCAGARWRLGPR
jgi:iron complex outermembrane recepter protein